MFPAVTPHMLQNGASASPGNAAQQPGIVTGSIGCGSPMMSVSPPQMYRSTLGASAHVHSGARCAGAAPPVVIRERSSISAQQSFRRSLQLSPSRSPSPVHRIVRVCTSPMGSPAQNIRSLGNLRISPASRAQEMRPATAKSLRGSSPIVSPVQQMRSSENVGVSPTTVTREWISATSPPPARGSMRVLRTLSPKPHPCGLSVGLAGQPELPVGFADSSFAAPRASDWSSTIAPHASDSALAAPWHSASAFEATRSSHSSLPTVVKELEPAPSKLQVGKSAMMSSPVAASRFVKERMAAPLPRAVKKRSLSPHACVYASTPNLVTREPAVQTTSISRRSLPVTRMASTPEARAVLASTVDGADADGTWY